MACIVNKNYSRAYFSRFSNNMCYSCVYVSLLVLLACTCCTQVPDDSCRHCSQPGFHRASHMNGIFSPFISPRLLGIIWGKMRENVSYPVVVYLGTTGSVKSLLQSPQKF